MPTPNTPAERARTTRTGDAAREEPAPTVQGGTPTDADILREQELSVERQKEGRGWASQSTAERRGEPEPAPPTIEPGQEGERVPVRNTARLAEEGQAAGPRKRDEPR